MITAENITDEQIRELNDQHQGHDEDNCVDGKFVHIGALIQSCVALGVLSEAYPGARLKARARCAELLNARTAPP